MRNKAMLRAIPDWMFLTTVDGVFLDYHVKDTSRLHTQPSAFLGKSVREVLPADVGDIHMAAFATEVRKGHLQLAVGDRGTGIPVDELDRIFEPFVTIGKRGSGLGLGLAISRSIVVAHHGSIRAENNAEGGATFRCFLPLAESATTEEKSRELAT